MGQPAAKPNDNSGRVRYLRTLLLERFTLAVVFALMAMAIFAAIAYRMHEGETRRWDAAVFQFFQARQTLPLHAFMTAVTFFGSSGALIIAAVLMTIAALLRPQLRPNALSLLVAVIGGEGLLGALKSLFHRARPEPIFAHLGYSFPSGHAFFSMTIYGMLAYWLTRESPRRRGGIWAIAAFLIFLIGFSRVYLGVHYASDVLAGFAAGLPWLWACLALPKAFGLMQREAAR